MNKEEKAAYMKEWRITHKEQIEERRRRPENMEKARLSAAKYKKANPERVKATNKAQYEKNAETIRAQAIARYYENATERAEYRKRYYDKNRDAAIEYSREYAAKNAAVIREKAAAYRQANRQARLRQKREWRARNPNASRLYLHTRRSKMRTRLSRNIVEKLMAWQRGKCAVCGCDLRKTGHHIDHIHPIALDGGNTDDNVQLLCPPCNLHKNAKHPVDFMQSRGFLL